MELALSTSPNGGKIVLIVKKVENNLIIEFMNRMDEPTRKIL